MFQRCDPPLHTHGDAHAQRLACYPATDDESLLLKGKVTTLSFLCFTLLMSSLLYVSEMVKLRDSEPKIWSYLLPYSVSQILQLTVSQFFVMKW